MSVARTPLSPALAAWLDGVGAAPEPVCRLQREMAGADDEEMMTHPDLGALLAVLVRATGGHRVLEIGTFVGPPRYGWRHRSPTTAISTASRPTQVMPTARPIISGARATTTR